MRSRFSMLACATVALATAACATTTDPTTPSGARNYPAGGGSTYVATVDGVVTRVDAPANVVMLDDGRMYQVVGTDAVVINGRPVAISGLQPGTRVTLRSPRAVMYQNGQYIAVTPGGTTASTTVAQPTTTITTAPGSTTVYTGTAAPGAATVYTGAPYSGTVVRVDETQRVLVFDDGRMWQTAGDSMVLVDGRPMAIGTVRPGTRVTVQQGYPVEYREGRYVQVVPHAAAAGVVRTTVYGRVTDVDRNGDVTIKTTDGEFEAKVPVTAVPNIKAGDPVTMDIVITPADGSALPRTR